MAYHDPRVDAYIANAAPFAQPILGHLRTVIHAACPDIVEGIKWSMPFFSYRDSPLCMMAAFKQHCGFGFWLSKQVVDKATDDGMGQFGTLKSVGDLPTKKQLTGFVRKAMALNEAGVKLTRPKAAAKPAPALPEALADEFEKKENLAARNHYQTMTAGKQRDYVEWIVEAKTEATRHARITSTLAWLSEGKSRHWKYEKC